MVNKKWEIDLVGILTTDEYNEEKNGRPAVFINSQNSLQFNVQVISQPPENFPEFTLFSAYTSDIEPYGFEDDFYVDDRTRIEALRDFLDERLMVFQPQRRVVPGGLEVFKVRDVRLVAKPLGYVDNTTYTPVPVFSQKSHGQTFREFLEKLWNNQYVGRIENFSTEPNDTPPFVLWKHEDESYTILGEFTKHRYAYGGFSFHFDQLVVNEFKDEWLTNVFEVDNLLFIGSDVYHELSSLMEETEALGHPDEYFGEVAPQEPPAPVQENREEAAVPAPAAAAAAAAPAPTAVLTAQKEKETPGPVKEEATESPEGQFLDYLAHWARERTLLYSQRDLINFHTAMKSSTLVILAGMSGTGKSRLVEVYGRALGMTEEQLQVIPVRPSWTDDADLIGYVDSIHNVYRPGDSGLINTLLQAERNQDKLYIVCFDEMNLARVEHYFSQFLSVLETTQASRKKLRLYNEELEARLYNSAQYPSTVTIGDNVMFVGTVNLDESTYHFSDKVLDRANVITLNVMPFHELKALRKSERKFDRKPLAVNEYQAFKKQSDVLMLEDREVAFLEEVHLALRSISKNHGIGHRIVRQIDAYLRNLPEREALSRRDAFDLQVVQRIFTKLRGAEDQLKALVGTVQLENSEVVNSRLLDLFDAYRDISDFAEAREVLLHKARELKLHGYAV